MKDTNVILYSPGAYGNFLHWCCDYFSGNLDSDNLPINDIGNFHTYKQNQCLTQRNDFIKYTESSEDKYQFIIIHESSAVIGSQPNEFTNFQWENTTNNILEYLNKNYKKIIYVHSTETSHYWLCNNELYKIRLTDWLDESTINLSRDELIQLLVDKHQLSANLAKLLTYYDIERIKYQIGQDSNLKENFKRWGHSGIDQFEKWELRELASRYYADRLDNNVLDKKFISKMSEKFPKIKFIELDRLRDHFHDTIKSILDYFNLNIVNWEKIDSIHQQWLNKQYHIYKDKQIYEIVDSLIKKKSLDWKNWNLTFMDEILIQRKLANQGILIKCFDLNNFPTNTNEFLPLLEKR